MDSITMEGCARQQDEVDADNNNVSTHKVNSFPTQAIYTDPTPAITGENLAKQYTSFGGKFFKCHVCKIEISGIIPFEQHLKGSKHKKRLEKLDMKEKCKAKYHEFLQGSESGNEVPMECSKIEHGSDAVVIKECDVCNKIFNGLAEFKLHLQSANHNYKEQLLKMQLAENLDEKMDVDVEEKVLNNSKGSSAPLTEPFAWCNLCNIKFTGPTALQEHLSGIDHKKKDQSKRIKAEVNSVRLESSSEMELCDEISEIAATFAYCKACKKHFTGPIPYQQHITSKAHERKAKKIGQVNEKKSNLQHDGSEGALYDKDHHDEDLSEFSFLSYSSERKENIVVKLLR